MNNTSITIVFTLVLVCHLYSETEWNPSISKTEKIGILKMMQEHQAALQAIRPIRTQISVRRDSAFPPNKLVCDVSVVGHTNIVAYRPFESQAFDFHLFDANGNSVHKTLLGWNKYGNSLKVDAELLDPRHHIIMNWIRDERTMNFNDPSWGNLCWRFDLLKCFSLEEPGVYHLQVQVRLFTKDANGTFQPFYLPSVETTVDVSDADVAGTIKLKTKILAAILIALFAFVILEKCFPRRRPTTS